MKERLYALRKQAGLSQEELAEVIGVSRQAVQKWEAGSASPDLGNLAALCDYFQVTMDYLVRGIETDTPAQGDGPDKGDWTAHPYWSYHRYEYISKRSILGLPLVHINLGYGFARAKGVIAIGNVATGVIACGGLSLGCISLGGLSLGCLALGGLSLGLAAFGGIALSLLISLGGLAISGGYAIGGLAIGRNFALGGMAIAHEIAVGKEANGGLALPMDTLNAMSKGEIEAALHAAYPKGAGWVVRLVSSFGR